MANSTRKITTLGIGIALFVVLSMMLQVPVFSNYYLCLGYVVMAVYLYSFGVVQGTIVGCLGVVLYCVLINGMRGMPGWAIGNVIIGIGLGMTFHWIKNMKNKMMTWTIMIVSSILFSALGILIAKSATEMLLYSQPMIIRMGKNMSGFIADAVMLILSLPICKAIDKFIKKSRFRSVT